MKMEKDGDPAEILVLPPILLRLRPYQYGDPVAILAERAVLSVKNLKKKCLHTDDTYMSLLELINTPCDDKLGSPMQRLMGHRANCPNNK